MTKVSQHLRQDLNPYFSVVSGGQVYFSMGSYDNIEEASEVYRALGRLLGICLLNIEKNVILPSCFPITIFKIILGEWVNFGDLELLFPDVASSIQQMCNMSDEIFDALSLTFSADVELHNGPNSSENISFDLIRNGSTLEVTHKNRKDYLLKYINFRLGHCLPLKECVLGVNHCCSRDFLSLFTPQMLQLLISGVSSFTVEELKEVTKFNGQSEKLYPGIIQWFWECVADMTQDELSLLLAFVTGSSNLPVGGIAAITITVAIGSTSNTLPTSSTCFNFLNLPVYESKEQLRERLLYAIQNSDVTHFGMM